MGSNLGPAGSTPVASVLQAPLVRDCSSAGLERHPAEVEVARSNRVSLINQACQKDRLFLCPEDSSNELSTIRSGACGTQNAKTWSVLGVKRHGRRFSMRRRRGGR